MRQRFEECNAGRRARLAEELPLFGRCRRVGWRRANATRRRGFKQHDLRVEGNVYSVNSRLIGEWVEGALVRRRRIEVWYAQKQVEQLPRLRGRGKHKIAYRHVIDWLAQARARLRITATVRTCSRAAAFGWPTMFC